MKANSSQGIQYIQLRNSRRFIHSIDAAVPKRHRKAVAFLFDKRLDDLLFGIDAKGQELGWRSLSGREQPIQFCDFGKAGTTPRRPEGDDQGAALIAAEGNILPGK